MRRDRGFCSSISRTRSQSLKVAEVDRGGAARPEVVIVRLAGIRVDRRSVVRGRLPSSVSPDLRRRGGARRRQRLLIQQRTDKDRQHRQAAARATAAVRRGRANGAPVPSPGERPGDAEVARLASTSSRRVRSFAIGARPDRRSTRRTWTCRWPPAVSIAQAGLLAPGRRRAARSSSRCARRRDDPRSSDRLPRDGPARRRDPRRPARMLGWPTTTDRAVIC